MATRQAGPSTGGSVRREWSTLSSRAHDRRAPPLATRATIPKTAGARRATGGSRHASPDGRLFVQTQARDQRRLELRTFDPSTGKGRTLLVEESRWWVNLHHDLHFLETGEYICALGLYQYAATTLPRTPPPSVPTGTVSLPRRDPAQHVRDPFPLLFSPWSAAKPAKNGGCETGRLGNVCRTSVRRRDCF
ncbi:MAG: DPP IV N-terminal domain-containing protein [Planctomycetes bacterium]|nr:DPP IV N-terminal domain-containing protein [Planctomycetota bacterium]